jgi:two-component system chemotaxis sensor kinase CheA
MALDPYRYFRIEAREILEELGKGVLALEKGPTSPELVARLLRSAHTLKGAARVVKERAIAEHAHSIEDVLAPHRDGIAVVPRERVDDLLRRLDAIGVLIANLSQPVEANDLPGKASDEPSRALRADVNEVEALLEGVVEVGVPLASVRRSAGSLEHIRHMIELISARLASPRAASDTAALQTRGTIEDLRRAIVLLERELGVGIEQTDRELRQVREAAERLRLLPAGTMFGFLERAVRDVAVSLGKRVAFEAIGGDIRLDGDVLGPIQSALLQAARNAVAHGLEHEGDRVNQGKSPVGTVSIVVTRRGDRVSFACADDGCGVDGKAVRRVAAQRGAPLSEAKELDPREITRLLLKGGISTSDAVTGVSGRGVGLDIVREAASRLGGEVEIRTEPGKGTTVEIVVPVMLSSLDVLILEVNGRLAAIPLDKVRRTLRLGSNEVTRNVEGESILVDGSVIPFAPLARLLNIQAETSTTTSRAWSVVIVESAEAIAAVGVDRLLGTENVLVRSLPALAFADAIIAGGSLDAEGNPQLVLDPDGVVAAARRLETLRLSEPKVSLPILVIDDSLTTRMLEQSILESAGYEVDVATSGEQGLERANARRYALFLVDVEMPGMDGFTFIEKTRADPVLRDTPAILVTSRASPEDRRRGETAGARAYIVKSEFEQTGLLKLIQSLVARR